jgi:L-asparaginase
MIGICLLTTGGTIASKFDAETGDVTASIKGNDLRAMVHDPLEGMDIEVEEFCSIGSYAMDISLAYALATRVNEKLADPAIHGVVVTHGTDTMEESAFLVDLLLASDKPVVFTGAQRNADHPDTDGPRNIADSIRLAGSPLARGLGAMICFEQEFHAARDVLKTHTSRVDTFRSGDHGKLGEIDGKVISLSRRPVLRKTYAAPKVETDIELIKMVMGASDRAIRFAASSGARAIVIEGFGIGNTTPAVTFSVRDIIAGGTPVIVTSRCSRGRVKPVYGKGGGKDLEAAGAIFAGDLSGPKARILAAVLSGLGLSIEEMRSEFTQLGGIQPE